MDGSLIKADDYITLWGIIVVWAAVSIYLEQKYKWASRISGAIIALIGAIILSNTGVIPTDSPVYDAIWGFIIPLAIPLLLFHVNFKKIWQETRKWKITYHFLIKFDWNSCRYNFKFLLIKRSYPIFR